jgi:hypothetical protein
VDSYPLPNLGFNDKKEILSVPEDCIDQQLVYKNQLNKLETLFAVDLTLFLAVVFTLLQIYEYCEFSFNISDSV